MFTPLLTSGTSTALSIDWNEGATTIIMINRTRKISVNGVILISLNIFCFLFVEKAIFFTCYKLTFDDEYLVWFSFSASTKLRNNNLISWKSSS